MRLLDGRICHVIITRNVTWLPTVKIPEQGGGAFTAPSAWNKEGVQFLAATAMASVPMLVCLGIRKTMLAVVRRNLS